VNARLDPDRSIDRLIAMGGSSGDVEDATTTSGSGRTSLSSWLGMLRAHRWRVVTALAACGATFALESAASRTVESGVLPVYERKALSSMASLPPERRAEGGLGRGANAGEERTPTPTSSSVVARSMATAEKKTIESTLSIPSTIEKSIGTLKNKTEDGVIIDPKCDEWTEKLEELLSAPKKSGTVYPPPYTCSNEHKQPCLQDTVFFQLVPDACSTMRKYSDWPGRFIFDVDDAKDGDALLDAAGRDSGKKIFIVGASMAMQIKEGVQCSLQRAGMDREVAKQTVKRWGWARYAADGGKCGSETSMGNGPGALYDMEKYKKGCWKDTSKFDEKVLGCDASGNNCDAKNRIVVIMYNIEHYGGVEFVEHFVQETKYLAAHAVKMGAKTIIATSPPKHFSDMGAYTPDVYKTKIDAITRMNSTCKCTPTTRDISSSEEFQKYFAGIEEIAALPGVLGMIDLMRSGLRALHGAHKGGWCGYFRSRAAGDSRGPLVRVDYRPCCDCGHFCFDPALWDKFFIAPLVDILSASADSPP